MVGSRSSAEPEARRNELDALQTGLEKKACVSSNDAKFIGLQESYWNMVEQEFPRWIARNKDSSKTQ